MSKPIIIGATAEAAIAAGEWLVAGTTSGVKPAAGAVAALGIAESFADPALPDFQSDKVGVIKQGLLKVTAAAATYAFGDTLELDSTGQVVTAETSNPVVATAAEDLVLAADGALLVYINLA